MARSPWSRPSAGSIDGVFARLVDAGGLPAACKLVAALGGAEIKLSARPGSKLARIVGDEAARAIVDALGAEKITIPMAHIKGQAGRREMAARLLAEGRSVAEVAARTDVHERTAWRVRAKLKDDRQLPLFTETDEEREDADAEEKRAALYRRT